jgi:hypothetical protein
MCILKFPAFLPINYFYILIGTILFLNEVLGKKLYNKIGLSLPPISAILYFIGLMISSVFWKIGLLTSNLFYLYLGKVK